jgi:hypothetical protein
VAPKNGAKNLGKTEKPGKNIGKSLGKLDSKEVLEGQSSN